MGFIAPHFEDLDKLSTKVDDLGEDTDKLATDLKEIKEATTPGARKEKLAKLLGTGVVTGSASWGTRKGLDLLEPRLAQFLIRLTEAISQFWEHWLTNSP